MQKPMLTAENFEDAVFESLNIGPLEFLTPVDHYGNTIITDRRVEGFKVAYLGAITPDGVLLPRNEEARALVTNLYREHKSEAVESLFHPRFTVAFKEN